MTKNKGIYLPPRDEEDLSQLTTVAKTQLVDAINEVNSKLSIFTVNPVVVPHVGGGNEDATLVSTGVTYVDSSASSSGDSLQLPPAVAGSFVMLIQGNTASELSVFVRYNSGDTMNGIIDLVDWAGAQSDLNPNAPLIFVCTVDGAWWTNGTLD